MNQEGFGALSARAGAAAQGDHATLYNDVRHIEDVEAAALAELMSMVPVLVRETADSLLSLGWRI